MKLTIILASTRDGRKGPSIADWIFNGVQESNLFNNIERIDLRDLNLPFMNEPNHPSMQQYTQQHTKDWSETISSSDAFIFITCEYNHGMPAPLKNAIDYLSKEWGNKPVGMVGYGGVSGGTRAIQQLKQVTGALKMFAFDGVILPFFAKQIDESGVFQPSEGNRHAAEKMISELSILAKKLKALRN